MGWVEEDNKWIPECDKCKRRERNMLRTETFWDANGMDGTSIGFLCKKHIEYDKKGNPIYEFVCLL